MIKEVDIVITQSLMKDWLGGMCPLLFQARWIDKSIPWGDSEAMLWGRWFEYQILGGTAKDEVPELTPKMEKSVTFKRANAQMDVWNELIKTMDIKIEDTQTHLETEVKVAYSDTVIPIKIGGTLDIKGTVGGKPAIIDVKTTADVAQSYGDFGWGNLATVNMKQAVHYTLLSKLIYGEYFDFYYIIFDWSPRQNVKVVKVEVSENGIEHHMNDIFKVWSEIFVGINNGFVGTPSYNVCKLCLNKDNCEVGVKVPEIEVVTI